MNKLIAIVGMCGSGKSVACEKLVSMGYNKIYFGGVTMDCLKEKGLEINPENEKMMREKLREDLGMGAFAIILLPKIEEAVKKGDTVLDGVYSYDEVKILKDKFANLKIVAVVCDKKTRYERLKTRSVRPLTPEEAEKRDISEVENIKKAPPIVLADYYIDNNGTVEEYNKRILEILNDIGSDK